MGTRIRLQIGLAVALVGIVISGTHAALAATTTFRVASVEGKSGSTVDVPIQAVGAPGLGAVQLELLYDAKVVTPDSVSPGSLTGSGALLDSNPQTAGRLVIGLATLKSIQGDGPLLIVRFKVVGATGSSSPLTLQNSKAWESGSHAEVLVKTEAGKVTVVGGFPSWLWLLIALLVILLLVILFLLFRRRRGRAQPARAR